MRHKITSDGFIWLVVTDSAKELLSSGALEMYALHDDDSESLILTQDTLNRCLESGTPIGIEVGFINQIISNHERNQTTLQVDSNG